MEPTFPITLRERDSGREIRCASIHEIQFHVEKIDVENGEYEVRDAEGRSVQMTVGKPVWIQLQLMSSVREDGGGSGQH
jgi:hypothetical protein